MDVSQYLEIFIDESAEHLQTLSDCIMELEKEPDNKDVINEIFRAAHSLKGMAGTMGFKRMQHLTHDMENVFQEVRSEKIQVDSQMIDLLFKCLDAIDGYLENIKATSDEGEEDNEVIIKELNNFLAKANGEAAAAEAAPAETEKEAAAPTDNGDHKLYLQIDLTDQERDAVMTAKDSGMHIYGMTVMIQKECLLKAARAFLVFREVEAFGEILVYRPSSQDIEDEKFEQEFSFYVASPESFDKIQNAAKNVSEIEDAVGEELTDFSPRVTETETEEKKEEKIYTIGETVTYTKNSKDLIHFTVDSVRNTDDRNEFADSQPEQVIIIHYSYENIANEDDIYFSSINFKVIDEGGNVCETYPASINTYPQTAPIGTKSEGEEAFGLKQQSSKIKLIVELDYSGTKATYELPIQ